MRLWIVNEYAVSPLEPGGTRHYSLARGLVALGHEVELIASARNNFTGNVAQVSNSDIDGVSLTFVAAEKLPIPAIGRGRVASMLAFARSLRRVLQNRSSRPDVLIGSTPNLFVATAAYLEARRMGVPFVLEVRDIWPETLVDLGGYSRWNPGVLLFDVLARFLYRRADHVITLLPFAGEHIKAKGGSDKRITWVPNGIDLGLLPSLGQESAVADGTGPFTITYAGAHGLANALDAILDAARLLDERHPGRYHFRFIGNGHDKSRLVERASTEGIANVSFLDPVPKRDVYRFLVDSDALVVNMNEGGLYRFGISFNKLFYYLAVGRPIVFGSAARNDPVRDAGAGLCVAANDVGALAQAVEQLAGLPAEEREKMGARGRAYVEEHHDMTKLAARLSDVLESLVSQHRLAHE